MFDHVIALGNISYNLFDFHVTTLYTAYNIISSSDFLKQKGFSLPELSKEAKKHKFRGAIDALRNEILEKEKRLKGK